MPSIYEIVGNFFFENSLSSSILNLLKFLKKLNNKISRGNSKMIDCNEYQNIEYENYQVLYLLVI